MLVDKNFPILGVILKFPDFPSPITQETCSHIVLALVLSNILSQLSQIPLFSPSLHFAQKSNETLGVFFCLPSRLHMVQMPSGCHLPFGCPRFSREVSQAPAGPREPAATDEGPSRHSAQCRFELSHSVFIVFCNFFFYLHTSFI